MITRDPARMGGQPCIDDTRITAGTVLLLLARHSDAEVLAAYPALTQAHLDGVRAWWCSPEGIRWALEERAQIPQVLPEDSAVICEIMAERARAFAKWGPQPHPWSCWADGDVNGLHAAAQRLEREARNGMFRREQADLRPTWAQILGEEAGEGLGQYVATWARPELVQIGAMVVAALAECPDFRPPETP